MVKNALIFFPENPFSNRAGNVSRAFSVIKIVKELGFSIDLVGSQDVYSIMSDQKKIDKRFVNELFLISKKPSKKNILSYLKYKIQKKILKSNPYNGYISKHATEAFEKIILQKKYDLIVINYETWSDLIKNPSAQKSQLVIDTHDWMTLNNFYTNPKMDLGKKFAEEIENLSLFNHIVTISHQEYFVFRSFLGDKVIHIPPSFADKTDSASTRRLERIYDLIFVGSDNAFNIKSFNWFLNEVLPLITIDLKICVIGRVCNHIPDGQGVIKINHAKNLDDYYHKSKVSICPILEGTGIKIKVVEALSYGLPVVGTTKALDGFEEKNNNGCTVSDDPKMIAKNIEQLLTNEDLYNQQKKLAKDYFQSHFSEENAKILWKSLLIK